MGGRSCSCRRNPLPNHRCPACPRLSQKPLTPPSRPPSLQCRSLTTSTCLAAGTLETASGWRRGLPSASTHEWSPGRLTPCFCFPISLQKNHHIWPAAPLALCQTASNCSPLCQTARPLPTCSSSFPRSPPPALACPACFTLCNHSASVHRCASGLAPRVAQMAVVQCAGNGGEMEVTGS